MKKQAICNLSVVPMRAEPSHRSEMVSQLLFGEYFLILEEQTEWLLVKGADPAYEGWIQRGQHAVLENGDTDFSIVGLEHVTVRVEDRFFPLLHGCVIPDNSEIQTADTLYHIQGQLRKPTATDLAEELPKLIKYYMEAPYLWGGRSRFGIDCSGLTQIVYRHFGISIPRDAYLQAEQGQTIDFLQEARMGDLAFFDNEEGVITHVGLLLDNAQILHASGKVRLDKVDTVGIYHTEQKMYTHQLRIIKRIFS